MSRLHRYSLRTPRLAPVVDAPVIRARFLRQSLVPPLAPFLGSSALRSSRITFLATTTSPPIASGRSPQAAWLYHMRLADFWASLFSASLPPASGLTASSCSYGREFAFRFFQLRLAATPCGSATVAVIGPGSFAQNVLAVSLLPAGLTSASNVPALLLPPDTRLEIRRWLGRRGPILPR